MIKRSHPESVFVHAKMWKKNKKIKNEQVQIIIIWVKSLLKRVNVLISTSICVAQNTLPYLKGKKYQIFFLISNVTWLR